jgi:ElaB/YqjD/DUF883 family membrane-anchored ribosome-binding protein
MTERNNAAQSAGLIDKVKRGAVSQLNTQKNRATDGISSVVQAVRQSTGRLREEHGTIAGYVDEAASQVDRFASDLKQKDAQELLQDAQRFARRNPAVFVGSAFAVGLLAARFFKSSRERNGRETWSGQTNYGGLHRSGGRGLSAPTAYGGPVASTRTPGSTTAATPSARRTAADDPSERL